jgi:hypothetical protein
MAYARHSVHFDRHRILTCHWSLMMTTLLHHPYAHGSGSVDVQLDLSLNDIDDMTTELANLVKDAKAAQRKVGCVIQQFGGNTYFTYDDASRAQLEISLIAALVVPKADVHVTQESGRSATWKKY